MRVDDIFHVGEKTIFAGTMTGSNRFIASKKCILQIEGLDLVEVEIKGVVQNNSAYRDLWTDQSVNISRKDILGRDVWLIEK